LHGHPEGRVAEEFGYIYAQRFEQSVVFQGVSVKQFHVLGVREQVVGLDAYGESALQKVNMVIAEIKAAFLEYFLQEQFERFTAVFGLRMGRMFADMLYGVQDCVIDREVVIRPDLPCCGFTVFGIDCVFCAVHSGHRVTDNRALAGRAHAHIIAVRERMGNRFLDDRFDYGGGLEKH